MVNEVLAVVAHVIVRDLLEIIICIKKIVSFCASIKFFLFVGVTWF